VVDGSEEGALHAGGLRIGGGGQGTLSAFAAIPAAASSFPARAGRVPPEVLELIEEPGAHREVVLLALLRRLQLRLHI